jgi:plastocyanin
MRRTASLLAVLALTATLAGCGSSGSSSSSATTVTAATTPSSGVKVNTTPAYGVPAAGAPVLSGSTQIAYRNITIAPDVLRVKVGTVITWHNYDGVTHNVTSQSGPLHFASGGLHEGASFTIRASRPGVIHYLCTIHPASMNGTIEVVR